MHHKATTGFQKNLPMIATYSRIVATIPILVFVKMGLPWSAWPASILFILASMTDGLDGYWARIYNVESAMGKFMDPIADKILVLAALLSLMELGRIDSVMVMILIGRDIFIGGIRSVAATNKIIIDAKPFGKWKTAIQMVSIPCLLVYDPSEFFNLPIDLIGFYGLWVSVILSLISGVQYTLGYYKGTLN